MKGGAAKGLFSLPAASTRVGKKMAANKGATRLEMHHLNVNGGYKNRKRDRNKKVIVAKGKKM